MTCNDIGKKIKTLREARNMTLEQVGNIVGVGKSTVRKWETGEIANMRRDKIAKLAEALGVEPSFLMGWEDKEPTTEEKKPHPLPRVHEGVRIPVYGSIPCGVPIEAIDDITDWEDIPKEWCTGIKNFLPSWPKATACTRNI